MSRITEEYRITESGECTKGEGTKGAGFNLAQFGPTTSPTIVSVFGSDSDNDPLYDLLFSHSPAVFTNTVTNPSSIDTTELQIAEDGVEIAMKLVDERESKLEFFINNISTAPIVTYYDFEKKLDETEKLLNASKDVSDSRLLYNIALKNLAHVKKNY